MGAIVNVVATAVQRALPKHSGNWIAYDELMRSVLWVVLAVFLAGCVHDKLIECGELLCPADQLCVPGPRCVTSEQLSVCAGSTDGTLCTTASGDGVCQTEVCVIGRCGNGAVEPGEVCDDGNRISGDECREDCLSDERCGNGLIDLGESCDCGENDATKPAYCRTSNAMDLEADCDLACSRRCGDNMVTGTEPCDGTESAFSCQDLGYYTGTMGCTPVCRLDTTACSGQCGDNVVQLSAGEQCDGAPPLGESCVSFGFDAGSVGCNELCAADLAGTCTRFGWTELLPLDSTKRYLDADANRHGVIAIEEPDSVVGLWDAAPLSHPGAYRFSVATGDRFIVIGDAAMAVFDGAWTDVAPPPAPPRRVGITATGTVFAMRADCTVDRWDGTWTTLATKPAASCFAFHAEADSELYVGAGATLYRYDGTAWNEVVLPDNDWPIYTITKRTQGVVIGREDGVKQVGGTPFEIAPSDAFATAATGGVVLAVYDDHSYLIADSSWVQVPYVRGNANHGLLYDVRRSPDGDLIGFAKGVYKLGPMWFDYAAPNTSNRPPGSVHIAASGVAYACGEAIVDLKFFTDLGWDGAGPCEHLYTTSTETFALTGDTVHTWGGPTNGWPGEFSPGDGNDACDDAECLVGGYVDPSIDRLYLLSTLALYRRDAESDFLELGTPTPCLYNAISGLPGDIYISGSCGVHHFDGTWHALPAPPRTLDAIYAAPNGDVFGVARNSSVLTTAYRFRGGTWTTIGTNVGLTITGTSDTDVIFGQGDYDHAFEVLYRWDGTVMSSIRLDAGALGVDSVTARGDILGVYRSSGRADVLYRPDR